jgi:hypothetical protein
VPTLPLGGKAGSQVQYNRQLPKFLQEHAHLLSSAGFQEDAKQAWDGECPCVRAMLDGASTNMNRVEQTTRKGRRSSPSMVTMKTWMETVSALNINTSCSFPSLFVCVARSHTTFLFVSQLAKVLA